MGDGFVRKRVKIVMDLSRLSYCEPAGVEASRWCLRLLPNGELPTFVVGTKLEPFCGSWNVGSDIEVLPSVVQPSSGVVCSKCLKKLKRILERM